MMLHHPLKYVVLPSTPFLSCVARKSSRRFAITFAIIIFIAFRVTACGQACCFFSFHRPSEPIERNPATFLSLLVSCRIRLCPSCNCVQLRLQPGSVKQIQHPNNAREPTQLTGGQFIGPCKILLAPVCPGD